MWLPEDLVRKILDLADLSIDTRRAFGLGPRLLPPWRAAHIGWLLQSRGDGLFYDWESKALHNFVVPGTHIVRRPIEFSLRDDGLTIFNLRQDEYSLEIYGPLGDYMVMPGVRSTWATELRVLCSP
jgi:hypothetical protein